MLVLEQFKKSNLFYFVKVLVIFFQFFQFRQRVESEIDQERRLQEEEQRRSDEWNGMRERRGPIRKPFDKAGNSTLTKGKIICNYSMVHFSKIAFNFSFLLLTFNSPIDIFEISVLAFAVCLRYMLENEKRIEQIIFAKRQMSLSSAVSNYNLNLSIF